MGRLASNWKQAYYRLWLDITPIRNVFRTFAPSTMLLRHSRMCCIVLLMITVLAKLRSDNKISLFPSVNEVAP